MCWQLRMNSFPPLGLQLQLLGPQAQGTYSLTRIPERQSHPTKSWKWLEKRPLPWKSSLSISYTQGFLGVFLCFFFKLGSRERWNFRLWVLISLWFFYLQWLPVFCAWWAKWSCHVGTVMSYSRADQRHGAYNELGSDITKMLFIMTTKQKDRGYI